MSANLALALNDLRSFADAKLSLLDDLGKQHSEWLTAALNGLNERRNRKADGPPPGHVEASKRPRGRPPRPTRGAKSKSVPKVAQEDDTQAGEPSSMEPKAAIVQEVAAISKRVTRSRAPVGESLPISNADAPVRRSTRSSKSAASESARLEDIPVETEAVRTKRSTRSSVVSVPFEPDSPGNEPVPESSKKRKGVTKSARPASSKKGKPPEASDDEPKGILGAEPSPRLAGCSQDCHDNMPEMDTLPERPVEAPVVAELQSSHGGEQAAAIEHEVACDAERHSPKVKDLPVDADKAAELETSTSPGKEDMELQGTVDHLEESPSPKRSGGTPQVSSSDAEIDLRAIEEKPKADAEELTCASEMTSEAPPTIDADIGRSPAEEECTADTNKEDDEASEKLALEKSPVEVNDAPSVVAEPAENESLAADQSDDDPASGAAAEPLENDQMKPSQSQPALPDDSAMEQPEPQAPPPPARSMASNLVSAVRSLLPLGGGGGVIRGGGPVSFLAAPSAPQQQSKPPARVAALEKAEAARKAQEAKDAERERRKQELERLKAERQASKAAAEADAAAARVEQGQRKQREAAARRQQLQQNSSQQTVKKVDSDAGPIVKQAGARPAVSGGGVNPAATSHTSAATAQLSDSSRIVSQQAARPLKKIMYKGQHQSVGAEAAQASPKQASGQLRLATNPNAGKMEVGLKPHAEPVSAPPTKQPGPEQSENQANTKSVPSFQANKTETQVGGAFPRLVLNPLATNRAAMVQATTATNTATTTPPGQQQRPRASSHGSQHQYEISPYRSDDDESSEGDDGPKKPVPEWAKGKRLQEQLVDQMRIDPDEIFQQQHKTCTLDEMFENPKNGQRDFSRRTSTGNWAEDRLTWQEELRYKKTMGFI